MPPALAPAAPPRLARLACALLACALAACAHTPAKPAGPDLPVPTRLLCAVQNMLDDAYAWEVVELAVDGTPVSAIRDDAGAWRNRQTLQVFDQEVAPGAHKVSVDLLLRSKDFPPAPIPWTIDHTYAYGLHVQTDAIHSAVHLTSSCWTYVAPGKSIAMAVQVFQKHGSGAVRPPDEPYVRYVMLLVKPEYGPIGSIWDHRSFRDLPR